MAVNAGIDLVGATVLQLWWTNPVGQPGMNKGHKDAARDDNAGGLLGAYSL